jgi:hypothetical protein
MFVLFALCVCPRLGLGRKRLGGSPCLYLGLLGGEDQICRRSQRRGLHVCVM